MDEEEEEYNAMHRGGFFTQDKGSAIEKEELGSLVGLISIYAFCVLTCGG